MPIFFCLVYQAASCIPWLRSLHTHRTSDLFDVARFVLAQCPIFVGRMGKPREIAFAALYLCSDEARFVTGTSFSIDGGVFGADHPKLYDLKNPVHPAIVSKL